ncbi:MAG: hypothetical protein ABW166_05000 [Sedimenticola sp.]
MKKYFLVLVAEDGEYILDDFFTLDEAYDELYRLEDNYGDGQELCVR